MYPTKSNKFLFSVFPTTAERSYDSEEGEPSFYGLGQKWKRENGSDVESNEPWEEEVNNLVAWTNALDLQSLNYDN